ncbi:MAG: acetyltransferase [Alicyclobacillus sp.]|nr:acetyltransferase [Alicyclobacillus sp.]
MEASIDDKPILRNLMELYQYDNSEHSGQDPDSHGLYGYHYLDHYWTPAGRNEGRVPYLVKVDGRIAGFVLKGRWSPVRTVDHSVAEFFIMRKWRRQGIGRAVAHQLFDRHPGVWEVREERSNLSVPLFWRAVIGEYTVGQFEEINSRPPDWDGFVQVFEVRRVSPPR